jgi:hypothetical protein
MNRTEHAPKSTRVTTRVFAMLGGVLHIQGTRMPRAAKATPASFSSIRRPRVLLSLAVTTAFFALTASAFALAPAEPPETGKVEAITATTATVHGVLAPKATESGEAGSYFFLYGVSAPGACGEEALVPEGLGIATGLKEQPVEETLTNLHPHSKYTVCLVERNPEESRGAAVPFETLPAAPSILSESVAAKATGATLEAQVDPNNETTSYSFEYSKTESAGKLTGTIVKVKGASELEGGSAQTASVPTGVLSSSTTYFYRVVTTNLTGTADGAVQSFTTVPVPTTEAVTAIGTETATFNGKLNPLDPTVEAEYYFYFNRGDDPACTNERRTGHEGAGTGSGAEAVSREVEGLEPNQKYTVCLVSANEFGSEEALTPVHFTTLPAPAEVDHESVSNIKATEADLEGSVNPNNQFTECHFEYGVFSVEENTVPCTPEVLNGFGEQSVSPMKSVVVVNSEGKSEIVMVPAPITGLTPNTPYIYRIVTKNGDGEVGTGAEEHFTTAFPPETPEAAKATGETATTAILHGVLNPTVSHESEPGIYEFVYRQSAKNECQGTGEKHAPEPAGTATGATPEPVEAEATGMLPGTTYSFCLLARNDAGETVLGPPESFTTLVIAPVVELESESASDVTADSVTLHAQVQPNSIETTYRFEYGTTEAYDQSSPAQSLEPGAVSAAEAKIQGLQANTTYHYRVVATNAKGSTPGTDETFTTQSTSTEVTLPDNRAYEMVTPVQKQGSLFEDTGPIRAAASGDAIADVATLPTEDKPEGNGETLSSILSTRGPSGWESRTIAAPHPAVGPAEEIQPEYLFFSEDLSSAVLEPPSGGGFPKLSPQATESTPYVHTLFFNGNTSEPCDAPYTSAESCYAPLAGSNDDTASPLLPFGELTPGGLCAVTFRCGPKVRGGSPDLSHLVLSSPVPLTATPAPTGGIAAEENGRMGQPDIYEYSAGQLQLLSILPRAQDPTQEGSPDLQLAGREGIGAAQEGKGAVAARHAISDDGNRVVLDELEGSVFKQRGALYLRDVTKGETIRLDLTSQGTPPEPNGEPEYVDANSEDTKIFFFDSAKLTADSGAIHGGAFQPAGDRPDLYECEITEENGKDHCALTDLTPETNHESARVASVLGVSEDGSYVYFAAAGDLGIAPAGATPGVCQEPSGEYGKVTGEEPPAGALCNVFVRHDGVTRFVAALSQQDQSDWANGASMTGQGVRVSPNGEWLAFLSNRPLTGYDSRAQVPSNCERTEGLNVIHEPCSEAYLYHAPADLGTEAGTLSCASCDPSGARPTGGASVPGWPGTFKEDFGIEAYYQPRYLTDEGRLFFNSPDALVPLDVSKHSEVFEYEPVGAGTCTEGTSSGSELYVPGEHGCVALISTGTAAEGSQFLEASAGGGEGEAGEPGSTGGRDVFFLTSEKVLPQDVDTAPDVYDAHECTTQSPCISVAPAPRQCETEASCKAPPTPQPTIYAPGGTATFSGPGNLIPPPAVVPKKVTKKTVKCKKGDTKNKKGNKCVKKPKKKKTKAKKSAHTNRRTSR